MTQQIIYENTSISEKESTLMNKDCDILYDRFLSTRRIPVRLELRKAI